MVRGKKKFSPQMEEISQLLTQEFSYQKKKKNEEKEEKFIYLKEPEVRIY